MLSPLTELQFINSNNNVALKYIEQCTHKQMRSSGSDDLNEEIGKYIFSMNRL